MGATRTLAPAPARRSEREALLGCLAAQRGCVLAVVDGLAADHLTTSVGPSGWTPLGLVAHLAGAERLWVQHVVAGRPLEPGLPDQDTSSRDAVLGYYRYQCARSDALLHGLSLDAPLGRAVPADREADHVHDVRTAVLQLIEETARHAGHLDIARELLDERTGPGPR